MDELAIRSQLDSLNIWQRGSQRAPHKPLLLLVSLASVLRGEPRLQPYEHTAEKLRQLLMDIEWYAGEVFRSPPRALMEV